MKWSVLRFSVVSPTVTTRLPDPASAAPPVSVSHSKSKNPWHLLINKLKVYFTPPSVTFDIFIFFLFNQFIHSLFLACYYNRQTYGDGVQFDLDPCTRCVCRHGDVECSKTACPSVNCPNPITRPGECCPTCTSGKLDLWLLKPHITLHEHHN